MSTLGRGRGTTRHGIRVGNRLSPGSPYRRAVTEGECPVCVRGMPSAAILDSMNGPRPPTDAEQAMNRRTTTEIAHARPTSALGARVYLPTEPRTAFLKIL